VLFTRCGELVQRPQAARRDLRLPQELAKLDRFDLLILDDLSYVRRDQAETSVLFELIAERYERKSLAITANTPFSQWGEVFAGQRQALRPAPRLRRTGRRNSRRELLLSAVDPMPPLQQRPRLGRALRDSGAAVRVQQAWHCDRGRAAQVDSNSALHHAELRQLRRRDAGAAKRAGSGARLGRALRPPSQIRRRAAPVQRSRD
jgi:hypothetical protein